MRRLGARSIPSTSSFSRTCRPGGTPARAIALAVYRQSTGLARRIIRRAYLTAFVGRRTPGTLELRAHPGYPAASRGLATGWAVGLAQAMAGALTPVYDRPRARRRARRSPAGAV